MRLDLHPLLHSVCGLMLEEWDGVDEEGTDADQIDASAQDDAATFRQRLFERHGRVVAQLGASQALDAVAQRGGWVRRHRYLVDVDNTTVAAERAVLRRDGEVAANCAMAAAVAETLLGRHATAAQRLVAPVAVDTTPAATRVRCLIAQGCSLLDDGRTEAAHRSLNSAHGIAQATGATAEHASALRALGRMHLQLGRPSLAYKSVEQARQLSSSTGDRMGHADALALQAEAQRESGDAQTAEHQLNEAHMAYQQLGARRREAYVLEQLGELHGDLGRHARARTAFDDALTIQRELGNRYGEARLLGELGELALIAADVKRAVSLLEQASGRGRELGACELEGRFMGALGTAYAMQNEHQRGWETLGHGEQLLRKDRPTGSHELLMLLCRRTRIEIMRNALGVASTTLHEIETLAARLPAPPMAVGRELVALRHVLRISDPPSTY
jgi:tetratricopeptide (TPR) repeat protein